MTTNTITTTAPAGVVGTLPTHHRAGAAWDRRTGTPCAAAGRGVTAAAMPQWGYADCPACGERGLWVTLRPEHIRSAG